MATMGNFGFGKEKGCHVGSKAKGGKSQVFEILYSVQQPPAAVLLFSCILKLLFAFHRAYVLPLCSQ